MSFENTLLSLARYAVTLPPTEITETKRMSDIDIMIAFADMKPQLIEDDICTICGDSHAIVQDYQEWIQCECCERWVHQYCDGILNAELAQTLTYTCPKCRILNMYQHPCNTNELLGKDPKYIQQDQKNKKQKAQRKRREDESDDESRANYVATTRRHKTPEENNDFVQQQQYPQLTQFELQQSFKQIVEEKQFVDKKKSLAFDSTCHSLLNFVNGSFNQLKQQTSTIFKNLQTVVRCDVQQQQKDSIDYAKEDVCFINYLALFQMQQLDQQDPMTQEMRDNRRGNLELEREKKHFLQIQQKIQSFNLQPLIPRQHIDILTPILQNDADLRSAVGLSIFDNLLISVERNRLAYLKTLVVPAAQACYIYQQKQNTVILSTDLFVNAAKRVLARECDQVDLSFNSYLTAEQLLAQNPHLLFKKEEIPELFSPRQWLDQSKRGLVNYDGVGLTRQTLLHAIVNVSLGLNIFDKVFGEQLTDHIIHFGVSSARRFIERQLNTSANSCSVETGCLFCTKKACEHEFCDCRLQNGLVGCAELIQGDQRIQDWDILETPTSVVFIMKIVKLVLDELK